MTTAAPMMRLAVGDASELQARVAAAKYGDQRAFAKAVHNIDY